MFEVSQLQTKASTIESTITKKDSAVIFAGSLAFAAMLLLKGIASIADYAALSFCTAGVVLGAMALLLPSRFKRGVRTFDGGFEHVTPLRGTQQIRFDAIKRVVAVATGGGDEGDDTPFMVYADGKKVILLERDLYTTGLFDTLTSLPGFKHDVLRQAANHEVKGLEILIGHRFVVFERT